RHSSAPAGVLRSGPARRPVSSGRPGAERGGPLPMSDPWEPPPTPTADPPGTRYFLRYGPARVQSSHPKYPGWIELDKYESLGVTTARGSGGMLYMLDERWVRILLSKKAVRLGSLDPGEKLIRVTLTDPQDMKPFTD